MSFQTDNNEEDLPGYAAQLAASKRAAFDRCIDMALTTLSDGKNQLSHDEESIQLALDLAMEQAAGWEFQKDAIESEVRRILALAAAAAKKTS